jgi:FG-GAP-like repeat
VLAKSQIAFEEVTAGSGINFVGRSMGLAWGDYNGDGWPDLYTSNHKAMASLYLNNRNGTFTNIFPANWSNAFTPDEHGAAFGDFDNDGDQDIMQLSGAAQGTGSSPDVLLVVTNGIARDEALDRGVLDAPGRGRTPLWLDWNNDGHLDLFFSNLTRPDGKNPSGYFEQIFGHFYRSSSPGLNPTQNSLFAQTSELLGDGRRLLIVQGDSYPQRIVAFGTDGSVDLRAQLHMPITSLVRDVAIEDFNGDLLPDLFMVRLQPNASEVVLANKSTLKSYLNVSNTECGMTFRCVCTLSFSMGPGFELKASNIFIGAKGAHPTSTTFRVTAGTDSVAGIAPHAPGRSLGLYVGYDVKTATWSVLASKSSRLALNVLITSTSAITQLNQININSSVLATPPPACCCKLRRVLSTHRAIPCWRKKERASRWWPAILTTTWTWTCTWCAGARPGTCRMYCLRTMVMVRLPKCRSPAGQRGTPRAGATRRLWRTSITMAFLILP